MHHETLERVDVTGAISPEQQAEQGREIRARELAEEIAREIVHGHNMNAPWETSYRDILNAFGVTFEDMKSELQKAFLKAHDDISGISFSDNVLGFWLEKYGISKDRFREDEGVQKTVVNCVNEKLHVDRAMLTHEKGAEVYEATSLLNEYFQEDHCPETHKRMLHDAIVELRSLYASREIGEVPRAAFDRLCEAAGLSEELAFNKKITPTP